MLISLAPSPEDLWLRSHARLCRCQTAQPLHLSPVDQKSPRRVEKKRADFMQPSRVQKSLELRAARQTLQP